MSSGGRHRSQSRSSKGGSPVVRLGVVLLITAAAVIPAIAFAAPGNFTPAVTSPETAGTAPISLVAANINGDAQPDLAVTDFVDSTVSILLGNGAGNFTQAPTSPEAIGSPSAGVAAGDFNNDGNTDLAAANLNAGNVSILLGNGSGDFTAALTSPESSGPGPLGIATARLNADANLDLAVTRSDHGIDILLGNGAGDFVPAGLTSEPTGGFNPRAIAVAPVDANASLDLIVPLRDSGNVSILLNNGAADFTPAAGSPEAVGSTPNSVATGDFNTDGRVDLAVPNRGDDNVSILLGDGAGNFTPLLPALTVGDNPRAVIAANFGSTPAVDLAVANADSDNISILFGNGAAGFSPADTSPEPAGDEPFWLATGNFGGDAGLDLASANPQGGIVSVLLNDSASAPPPTPPGRCKGKTATVTGIANRFVGTSKRDVIAGTRNRDTIIGKGGNDLICSGGGNDLTKAGGGKDSVYSGGGKDTVRGGGGNDTIRGQGGNDNLFGQGGRDRLLGQAGRDKLTGGPKRDTCIGGPGRDTRRSCERGS